MADDEKVNKKEDDLLRSATAWQWRKKNRTSQLGSQIQSFLNSHQKSFDQAACLIDAWEQMVPVGLKKYCRLDGFEQGELTVRAIPGPYMHQLKMVQSELVKELKKKCPRSGLRKIRLVAGSLSD